MNFIMNVFTGAFGVSTAKQAVTTTTTGVLGAILSYAFGGWNGMLEIFFIAMGLDYFSGCAASLKEGKGLDSKIGFWGLIKKILMVSAIYFSHRVDVAFNKDFIMSGMLTAFFVNELVSLTENYGRLGLPLSDRIQPLIAVLKQRGGGSSAGS